MVDVALQLQAQTPGQPHRRALARRPAAARSPSRAARLRARESRSRSDASLLSLLRFVRTAAVVAELDGGDWRDAVNALRPVTAELWAGLPLDEQRRFVERLARFWDIHRHRLAPEVATAVDALRAQRAASRSAAGASAQSPGSATGSTSRSRSRANGERQTLRVAAVVNCTGPTGNVRAGGSRLLDSLCASGTVRPHPLALGLDTCGDGAVLRRSRARVGDRSSRSARCAVASCGSRRPSPRSARRRRPSPSASRGSARSPRAR